MRLANNLFVATEWVGTGRLIRARVGYPSPVTLCQESTRARFLSRPPPAAPPPPTRRPMPTQPCTRDLRPGPIRDSEL